MTVKVDDVVLYYAERDGEQIRTPRRASVAAVRSPGGAAFAVSPGTFGKTSPRLDLVVTTFKFGEDDTDLEVEFVKDIPGPESQYGAVDVEYWALPA